MLHMEKSSSEKRKFLPITKMSSEVDINCAD